MRTECPSVYSQVLKYELNDIYHFIEAACLINIFHSFLKRGLSLRVFIFMHFLTHSFQIKNVILFTRFFIMRNYLSCKKKIGCKMLFSQNTINAVQFKKNIIL